MECSIKKLKEILEKDQLSLTESEIKIVVDFIGPLLEQFVDIFEEAAKFIKEVYTKEVLVIKEHDHDTFMIKVNAALQITDQNGENFRTSSTKIVENMEFKVPMQMFYDDEVVHNYFDKVYKTGFVVILAKERRN